MKLGIDEKTAFSQVYWLLFRVNTSLLHAECACENKLFVILSACYEWNVAATAHLLSSVQVTFTHVFMLCTSRLHIPSLSCLWIGQNTEGSRTVSAVCSMSHCYRFFFFLIPNIWKSRAVSAWSPTPFPKTVCVQSSEKELNSCVFLFVICSSVQ